MLPILLTQNKCYGPKNQILELMDLNETVHKLGQSQCMFHESVMHIK